MRTIIEELCNTAFYQGREISHINDRGVPVFKAPTFEGWLRDPKTQKEIKRLEKLYKERL